MAMISQITTCKGRWDDVKARLRRWESSGVDELIIVDFACTDNTYENLLTTEHGRRPGTVVIRVDPAYAGPFFNHGLARNIGAMFARGEYLLFCNADTYLHPPFFDRLENPTFDLLATRSAFKDQAMLPACWSSDDQVVVKNHVFWKLNGFDQTRSQWGAVTYDFLARAARVTDRVRHFNVNDVSHYPHPDETRDKFLVSSFAKKLHGRQLMYHESRTYYADRRKINETPDRHSSRAQPGTLFGLRNAEAIRVWRSGHPLAVHEGIMA